MSTSTVTKSQTSNSLDHGAIRTDSYVLLAALLNNAPSAELLELVQNLRWAEDLPAAMDEALDELNRAGTDCLPADIAGEFHRLFVGLGSGELVPYASWYREKMIQSKTLAAIRNDLNRLGVVRQVTCFEPEDHAGALCEIMALFSLPENGIAEDEQAAFYRNHLDPWMPRFFSDLQGVEKSRFYQTVGTFGRSFLAAESLYLHKYFSIEEKKNDPAI